MSKGESEGPPSAGLDFATLFAANIHEIKNQLFLLLNGVEAVSREPWAASCSEAGEALNRIKYGGGQIAQRLARLLALYRMAQGHYQLDVGYHDVAELLREVLFETKCLPTGREVSIESECDEELYGFFDREMVRGILINALHNALRFARGRIRLAAGMEDGMLCIRVEDDGPGFPAQVLQDGGRAAKLKLSGEGTGLGLYFSSTVAGLHQSKGKSGCVRLANGSPLGGAAFVLCLP